jgi:prepilin-type N-terminal cleavage/methylation domain-containing protein
MKKTYRTFRDPSGFSLAEVLTALTIGAIVLIAVLDIYHRVQSSAAAITRRLDNSRLPSEVLQRIAEDLDKIITPGSDTKITIESKSDEGGYQTARLQVLKTVYDSKNSPQTFEEIIWQSSYDYDSDSNGLTLYRSHTGIASEDKLLDKSRVDLEKVYSFVPVCAGITYFKIQVPADENFLDQWTDSSLPRGIIATISFAEPFRTLTGTLDVPEEEKITRTIAIDRTRKLNFEIVKKEYGGEPNDQGNQQEEGEQVDEQVQEDANVPEAEGGQG